MAAAILNIELEQHSNLTFDFTYYDSDKNAVNVTNYGGLILFSVDKDSKPLAYGTHNESWLQFGTTDGKITVNVPYTAYDNLAKRSGIWQLIIHPDASNINDRPKLLIRGEWVYIPSPIRFLSL